MFRYADRDDGLGDYKAKQLRDAEEDAMYEAPPVIVAKFVDPNAPKKPQTILGKLKSKVL